MPTDTELYAKYPHLKKWPAKFIRSFAEFAKYAVYKDQEMILYPIQLDFCNFIQPMRYWEVDQYKKDHPNEEDDPITLDKNVLCHRSFGKSQLIKFFILWYLSIWPESLVIFIGCNNTAATGAGLSLKQLIAKLDVFHHLRIKDKTNKKSQTTEWDTPYSPALYSQPSFIARSYMAGDITGRRASLIVTDDLEVSNSEGKDASREDLQRLYSELGNIMASKKPHFCKINLGTPHKNDSFHFTLDKEFGYQTRIWPAIYPDFSKFESEYIERVAPFYKHKLIENPKLVNKAAGYLSLRDLKAPDKGGYPDGTKFRFHYMLDHFARQDDIYPFKLQDLIIYDLSWPKLPTPIRWTNCDTNKRDYPVKTFKDDTFFEGIASDETKLALPQKVIMCIDPAGRGPDEEVWVVAAALNGYIYIIDMGGYMKQDTVDKSKEQARIAQRYNIKEIIFECNNSQAPIDILRSTLASINHFCTITGVHQQINKEYRIYESLYPVLAQHRLILNKKVIDSDLQRKNLTGYQLCYQLTHFKNGKKSDLKHDDRIDVLSLAIDQLSEYLSVNVNNIPKTEEEETIEQFKKWKQQTKNRAIPVAVDDDFGDISKLQNFAEGFGGSFSELWIP